MSKSTQNISVTLTSLNLEDTELMLIKCAIGFGLNITATGKLLGITRHSLKRRLQKHNLEYDFELYKTLPHSQGPEEENGNDQTNV